MSSSISLSFTRSLPENLHPCNNSWLSWLPSMPFNSPNHYRKLWNPTKLPTEKSARSSSSNSPPKRNSSNSPFAFSRRVLHHLWFSSVRILLRTFNFELSTRFRGVAALYFGLGPSFAFLLLADGGPLHSLSPLSTRYPLFGTHSLRSPVYSAVFNFNLLLFSSRNARKLSAVSSNRTHCS
jgi:hypothetical protein